MILDLKNINKKTCLLGNMIMILDLRNINKNLKFNKILIKKILLIIIHNVNEIIKFIFIL